MGRAVVQGRQCFRVGPPAEDGRADVVVFTQKALGGASIAERLGTPGLPAQLIPTGPPTSDFQVPFAPAGTPRSLRRASWSLVGASEAPWRRIVAQWRSTRLGLTTRPIPFSRIIASRGILSAWSPRLLAAPPEWRPSQGPLGFWRSRATGTLPADVERFLAAGPPPVVVGFGSMMHGDPARLAREVVDGLRRAGRRGILLAGWAGLNASGGDDVLAIEEAPLDGLLPRAAAVVHHGGVGTVGAALHAGTPQIIRPFFGDQPFWAGRLRELGVAPRPLKRVTGEALAERLRVIDDLAAVGTTALVMALHVYDAAFSASLRRRLMDKLARLPLGWFASRGSGEVKKIVGDDVNSLHYVVTHAETDCVGAVATPLIVLIYLFSVQWRLALVLLLPVLAYVIVMVRIMRRDADNVARSQRYTSRISAQTQTFISSRQEARVLGTSSVVDLPGTLSEAGDFIADWQMRTGPVKIIAVMLNRPTTVLGLLLVSAYLMMIPGWVNAAELLPFLILGTSFGGQLLGISTSIGALMASLQARDALETFLGTPELAAAPAPSPSQSGVGPPSDSRSSRSSPGRLALESVTFAYDAGHPVLSDVSLSLEPGVVTALVGPSGSGKSTVAALLARLWDPQGGRVTLDGVDLRSLTQDELYARVSILLQDVQLIRATVRDNIALTRPDATGPEIEAAARAARLHDTITALPQGYDTIVDSSRLSGGERQRLGIARALLADTPVVILDEATASADPDSELQIRQALNTLLKGRTVLMIAHRLHTIRDAGRIVVMQHGRVVETGTHDSLMADDGPYAALWAAAVGPDGPDGPSAVGTVGAVGPTVPDRDPDQRHEGQEDPAC